MQRKRNSTSSQMSSNASGAKETYEQKMLEAHKGIIEDHPTDKNRWRCIPCNSQKAKYDCGLWNNLNGHLNTDSHSNCVAIFELKDKKPDDKSSECDVGNQYNSTHREFTLAQEIDLDFAFTKFILESKLPFNMTSPLLDFVKHICTSFNNESLKQYELSSNTVQKINIIMSKTLKNTLF